MNVIVKFPKRGRPPVQRVSVDHGTPELQARRLALVNGGDPALAEYPLGVMLARSIIDQDQHTAGQTYGWLYAKAHGKTRELGFFDFPERASGLQDEGDLAKIERRYCDAKRCLIRIGRQCHNLVEDVTVYRKLPAWIGAKEFRLSWWTEREIMKVGLGELVKELL